MKPEIKNDPLRLALSAKERAYIQQRLRSAKRRLFVWLMGTALSAGAVLGGIILIEYSSSLPEINVDRAIAEIEHGTSNIKDPAECRGYYHIFKGTERTIGFCDDDPQYTSFRAHLEATEEEQGWSALLVPLMLLLLGGGFCAFVLFLAGIGMEIFEIWRYRKYRVELRAFLRRYKRPE